MFLVMSIPTVSSQVGIPRKPCRSAGDWPSTSASSPLPSPMSRSSSRSSGSADSAAAEGLLAGGVVDRDWRSGPLPQSASSFPAESDDARPAASPLRPAAARQGPRPVRPRPPHNRQRALPSAVGASPARPPHPPPAAAKADAPIPRPVAVADDDGPALVGLLSRRHAGRDFSRLDQAERLVNETWRFDGSFRRRRTSLGRRRA